MRRSRRSRSPDVTPAGDAASNDGEGQSTPTADRLWTSAPTPWPSSKSNAPERQQADLVRLEDDAWLDVLIWSAPVDEQRISQTASAAPTSVEMHGLISDVLAHDRGEIVHSTGSAWATAR